jgi:hypothetical protein
MIAAKNTERKTSPKAGSARISLRRAVGCYGTTQELPPLDNILFDKIFRTVELRANAANLPNSLYAPVPLFPNPQTGETK